MARPYRRGIWTVWYHAFTKAMWIEFTDGSFYYYDNVEFGTFLLVYTMNRTCRNFNAMIRTVERPPTTYEVMETSPPPEEYTYSLFVHYPPV